MNSKQENSLENGLFQLAFCQQLSLKEKNQLVQVMTEDPEAPPASLVNRAGLKRKSREAYLAHNVTFDGELERQKLQEWGIKWISRNSEAFPFLLKNIYDCPLGLFCLGNTNLLKRTCLSVVGARSCTTYGKETVRSLLPEIIKEDYVVVSGLAKGIDTEAHQTTIHAGGQTIAVIGTGIDLVYPSENKDIQKHIGTHHLLVSEYPLGTKPLKGNFPMRNRIIAGLSMGTLVVEARYRSGSLITANIALNEGREVFAVPGSVFNPLSEGTNDLIKHGAKCVLSAKDIIDETLFSL